MSDISASTKDNGIALWLAMVLIDQQRQVVHFIKERDPQVTARVMESNFFRCVEATQLVGTWDVLCLLDARGARFTRRWYSSSHFEFAVTDVCYCFPIIIIAI